MRFAFGKTIGEKAIPTAAKNATTQLVHPNVRIPNKKVNIGMTFEPSGSIFVSL